MKKDETAKTDEKKRIVWITCRSTRPCGGTTAEVSRTWKRPVGNLEPGPSRTTRYKCTKCGSVFMISV